MVELSTLHLQQASSVASANAITLVCIRPHSRMEMLMPSSRKAFSGWLHGDAGKGRLQVQHHL